MKLVSIPPAGVPPVDGTIRDATGRLIGAPSGDLPPVEIAMDFPVGKLLAVPGLPGPPGDEGPQGPPGPAFEGVAWWFGEGPPGVIVGSKPGDRYLDTSTGTIYVLGD